LYSCQGFQQQAGFDYSKTFSPVGKWETIRIVMALLDIVGGPSTTSMYKLHSLNRVFDEEVYMVQPNGLATPGTEHLVLSTSSHAIWSQKKPLCLVL